MISNALGDRFLLQRLFWFGVIALSALFAGYALATNTFMLFAAVCGLVWFFTLPYHTTISAHLAVVTFASALIMPFFPGRPFLWEFAALLGWTGMLVTVATRRYDPRFVRQIKEHRWLFVGALGYSIVLVVTMYFRGVGFRVLGGEQMGGRFYFQQLTCAIFPVVFVMCRFNERLLVRLFALQCLLTATYLVSDFVFSLVADKFWFLLQFIELPNDAINFQGQAMRFGIRRFQSLAAIGQGFFFLLLVLFGLKDFFGRRAFLLIPASLGILVLGLPSGHRWFIVIIGLTVLFCAYAQRFFTARNTSIAIGVSVLLLSFTYGLADRMPLAPQRALSFLPGIRVDTHARQDAEGTMAMRVILRKIGTEMIPQYFWLGRGFGLSALGDRSLEWDPTGVTSHLNMGRFYNGFIGLMVNTGVIGTFFMLLFLTSGTLLAWRIVRFLRIHGCDDPFARTSCVVAGLWIANTIGFLFLHGDSEWAMKTFSLQAGMLLACNYHLRQRLEPQIAGS